MSDTERIMHPIPPLYDEKSEILILGSFPSIKSRESKFFYGHPQNRFWKLIARLYNEEQPETIDDKKAIILKHKLALWDTIQSCTITGSSDSSIKDVKTNDIQKIINESKITRIFANGTTSYNLYEKFVYPQTKIHAIKLPSTSPANAVYTLDKLAERWSVIIE